MWNEKDFCDADSGFDYIFGMMNAIYGKTLQKAIFNKTAIVNNILEFNHFLIDKKSDNFDWIILNDNKIMVTGEIKDELKGQCVTKPCQLGAFVTAYSRRLMLFYIKAVDPTLQQQVFTYTDTDSLHLHGEAYLKLKELGYIKNKSESSLGFLCSDIDDEGIIIKERNMAPKTYKYEYVTNKNEVHINDICVMKCKGIPKKCLKSEYYEENTPVEVKFDGLQRKHKNLTRKDKEQGVTNFSIINTHQSRTMNKTSWSGMILKDNQYYPYGYEF